MTERIGLICISAQSYQSCERSFENSMALCLSRLGTFWMCSLIQRFFKTGQGRLHGAWVATPLSLSHLWEPCRLDVRAILGKPDPRRTMRRTCLAVVGPRPALGSTSQTFSLWLSASQGFSQCSARSLSYLSRRPDNSSELSVTVVHFPVASVPRSRFLATTPKEDKAEEKEKSIEASTPQATPQAEEAKIGGIVGLSFRSVPT